MKKFFRTIAKAASALAAVLVLMLGAARCTTVDNTLGQNFIPPYQQMKLQIDTMTPMQGGAELLKTYLAKNDSVRSSNFGLLMIGNMEDNVFGRLEASTMTDFFPQFVMKWTLSQEEEDEEENEEDEDAPEFGFHPAADSIYIELVVTDIKGNNTVEQTFDIYELRDSLKRDSMYYFNTPIDEIDRNPEPLFSFKIDQDVVENSIIMLKLEPTDSGLDFMRRLVELDDEVYKEPMYTFHKHFHGLYIAPSPDSPQDGALYQFNIRPNNPSNPNEDYAALIVWAHNHKENAPTQVQDTVVAYYRFSDISMHPNPNLNVNMVKFTYPAEIDDVLNDTLPSSPALETVYVQGLGGVASFLRFTDDMTERLKEMKTHDGTEYTEMVINDAKVYLPMTDRTVESLNAAPTRLGMYYTYGQPRREFASYDYPYWFIAPYNNVTPIMGPRPMADYAYYAENQSQNSTKLPYGGYINRTKGYYEMNITEYMTRLMLDPDHTPREIWLGPDVNTRSTEYSQVTLRGSTSEEDPIRIVITYTLIK